MIRNFCYADTCSTCEHAEILFNKPVKFLCRIKQSNCMIDCVSSIMSNYKYPKKNPLWDILLKECNEHYIYGRFDCCHGCKFHNGSSCIFQIVWNKL